MTGLYVDMSSFQSTNINWQQYKAWSEEGDRIARAAFKATEGVGFKDSKYVTFLTAAEQNGINQNFHYHFARPDLNSNPQTESQWYFQVASSMIRSNDILMLDMETIANLNIADWSYNWLNDTEQLFSRTPWIYASDNFVRTHLQDTRLIRFPLILANWTFNPAARPPCPPPWKTYAAIQYSDRAVVPGIPTPVDANVFIGVNNMGIPSNWHDDGTTLTAPNGHRVVLGFRQWVLDHNWDNTNMPLEEEYHSKPLELSNPSLGEGQKQCFNQTTLEFTDHVFEAYQGQEIFALRQEIVTLQNQSTINITDIKNQLQTIGNSITAIENDLS